MWEIIKRNFLRKTVLSVTFVRNLLKIKRNTNITYKYTTENIPPGIILMKKILSVTIVRNLLNLKMSLSIT